MMRTLRPVLCFVSVLLIGGSAFAQQSGPSAPEETDFVIPELILRVEELSVQEVFSVLPAEMELAVGRISIPLPAAEELRFGDEAFRVAGPAYLAPGAVSTVFSSGRLGAGTVNHIVGDLSLFKLGANPRFRLRFSYEGMDGYQFNSPGIGFFAHGNSVDGWLVSDTERTTLEAEGAFSETVDGLQGLSDYFSVGVRRADGDLSFTYRPEALLELRSSVNVSSTTRIESASGAGPAPTAHEIALEPEIRGRASIGPVDLTLGTSYFLRFLPGGPLPLAQDIDLIAGIAAEIGQRVAASVAAGVHYDFAGRLSYPWSAGLGVVFGEALETSVSGGYRIVRQRLGDLWLTTPLASAGAGEGEPDLVHDRQWYGAIGGRWSGLSGIAFQGGAEFRAHEAAIDLDAYDPVGNEFPFVQRPLLALDLTAGGSWRPSPSWQLQAGWTGRLLETVTGEPVSTVDASVRFTDASDRFAVSADTRTDFYPQVTVPRIGLSGSYAPSEGVEFVLEFADLLSPLLPSGRPSVGPVVDDRFPFIEPGFRVSVYTRISL